MTTAYELEQPWAPASEAIAEWGEDFHDLMLRDRLRMHAFAQAIAAAVRPGDTVVDLGTGTGILALWALRAGARRVYGIDFNAQVLKTAARRIAEAGFGDRFISVEGHSFEIELPELCDLVISETLGNLVDNEGCVPMLADAQDRFLAPGGLILPRSADSYLVPVAAERAHALVRAGQVAGGARHARAFNGYYDAILPHRGYLAEPQEARSYVFGRDRVDEYQEHLVFPVLRDGAFTGFKGYFVALLAEDVVLDISGDDIAAGSTSDSWKHCYLPVAEPVPVRAGDRITLAFARLAVGSGSFAQSYRWRGEVLREGAAVAGFDQHS